MINGPAHLGGACILAAENGKKTPSEEGAEEEIRAYFRSKLAAARKAAPTSMPVSMGCCSGS